MAEVRYFTSKSYEWIVEGDITACFDEISHPALMDRVRQRITDNRVLALVKAFLKAGILGEDRVLRDTDTGTPQGSILSPLLSNVALSVLDEHIARAPGGPASTQTERALRRRRAYRAGWITAGLRDQPGRTLTQLIGVLLRCGHRWCTSQVAMSPSNPVRNIRLLAPVLSAPPIRLTAVRPVRVHPQLPAGHPLPLQGPLVQAGRPHECFTAAVDHLAGTGTAPQ
ncbi:hypothetical protein GCM10027290_58910 [Micromonospora sonneratiae]